MTRGDLGIVIRGIAPTLKRLAARVAAVEGRSAVPGPVGEKGQPGRDGVDGKDGAPGAPGLIGKDGAPGLPGAPGLAGKDGAPGLPGIAGKDGSPGLQGKDGAPGAPGAMGPAGPRGERGERGEPGPMGSPGEPAAPPAEWAARMLALEARHIEEMPGDEIVAELAGLLRRDLLGALPVAPTMQKRILRDRHGKIERVIEEPTEAN